MEPDTKKAKELAARLKEAMDSVRQPNGKRCTQEFLAEKSKVTQATISRILRGRQTQGSESGTIRKLAEALGVNYSWLADGGSGPKKVGEKLSVRQPLGTYELASRAAEVPVEMPRTIPMAMTGPHFLTPDEWLLVSLSRRTDDTGRKDLLEYAGHLKMVLCPPIASNDPE